METEEYLRLAAIEIRNKSLITVNCNSVMIGLAEIILITTISDLLKFKHNEI